MKKPFSLIMVIFSQFIQIYKNITWYTIIYKTYICQKYLSNIVFKEKTGSQIGLSPSPHGLIFKEKSCELKKKKVFLFLMFSPHYGKYEEDINTSLAQMANSSVLWTALKIILEILLNAQQR